MSIKPYAAAKIRKALLFYSKAFPAFRGQTECGPPTSRMTKECMTSERVEQTQFHGTAKRKSRAVIPFAAKGSAQRKIQFSSRSETFRCQFCMGS